MNDCAMPGCLHELYATCGGGKAMKYALPLCFTHLDEHIVAGPHFHVGFIPIPHYPEQVIEGL